MCTLIAVHRAHPSFPLVVGANRDEYYARPTLPPAELEGISGAIAGTDARHGGTWLGATARGFFVGLTNQRTGRPADPTRRSRGQVVVEALRRGRVDDVDALLESLAAADYPPFNLLYGDGVSLRVAYVSDDPPSVQIEALEPGVWVLANDRIGSPRMPKAERTRAAIDAVAREPIEVLDAAIAATLADHTTYPPRPSGVLPEALELALSSVCVHTPIYGTRSSTRLRIDEGALVRYEHAEGPPCRHGFRALDLDR